MNAIVKSVQPNYEPHEIAGIFPLMQGDDYAALVDDIQKNGLVEPIWLYESKILDGRNRYRACRDAGIPVKTRGYLGKDPVGFVWSMNFHRRHMDAGQRAIAGAKRLPFLQDEAKDRQRASGRFAGKDADGNPQLQVQISLSEPEKQSEKNPAPQARDIAAEMAGVSPAYIQIASDLIANHPALADSVAQGAITLNTAKALRDVPPDEQTAIVALGKPAAAKAAAEAKKEAPPRPRKIRAEKPKPSVEEQEEIDRRQCLFKSFYRTCAAMHLFEFEASRNRMVRDLIGFRTEFEEQNHANLDDCIGKLESMLESGGMKIFLETIKTRIV